MGDQFSKLFEPIKIGSMELKNRLAAAPCVSNLATEDGYVSQAIRDITRAKAQGGWGLITIEASYIRPDGNGFRRMLGVYDDKVMAGLADLAYIIHEGDAKASIQIMHNGRHSRVSLTKTQPLAPSRTAPPWGGAAPKEMTEEDIEDMLDCFAETAARVQSVGFDSVMLHGAHGFIIGQFMSRFTNHRTDQWGDPTLFASEVVKRTRKAVGPNFPIVMRISADEMVGDKGLTLEDTLRIVPALEAAGLDALDVSAGLFETAHWIMQPIYQPRGVIVKLAEAVKKVVSIPVVCAGRINDPILANKIIADGRADIVSMTRQAIADPAFPRKVREGRVDEIRKCIACDLGCTHQIGIQQACQCAINYEFGREASSRIFPVAKPRKIVVVGGGVAGMEAARVASERGHSVVLFEKSQTLGGAVSSVASSLPRLNTRELRNIVEWETNQMKKLGVEVRLGKPASVETIEAEKPDAVIVATGARPTMGNIPGADRPNVMLLDDYFVDPKRAGQRVVVIGGHYGCELAVSLAAEGKKAVLLEEGAEVAWPPFMPYNRRNTLLELASQHKVEIIAGVKGLKIEDKGVRFSSADGQERFIEADNVIVAVGRAPNKELANELRRSGKVTEIHEIGDCREPASIMRAVHGGSWVGRLL